MKEDAVNYLRKFYSDKKVLVTGAHGFKGAWLMVLLKELGADVVGVGLKADDALLYNLLEEADNTYKADFMDIRDKHFSDWVSLQSADVVFHLAAQPIVSVGYSNPVETYETNVLGVVNLLEGVRKTRKKVSVVNVTTDKVYHNIEKTEPYVETDELKGEDPYSNSKSCSELVSFSYNVSFFKNSPNDERKILSTCRAGNVIGGGDFALNRIIPDMVRAIDSCEEMSVRNFNGVRPYEHVLDALYAYVLLAAKQYDDESFAGEYNVGPNDESLLLTKNLIDFFSRYSTLQVRDASAGEVFHEANLLSLDSSKFRSTFDWEPTWASPDEMLWKTFEWYAKYISRKYDMSEVTLEQVKEFLND